MKKNSNQSNILSDFLNYIPTPIYPNSGKYYN